MKNSEQGSTRWKHVDALLDAVIDLPPDQRGAYLEQACAGDASLKKEVEELLALGERANSFIEAPAFQRTSADAGSSNLLSLFQREPLLQPGKLIAGRYKVLKKLGKGGMGEVWHAYDEKLRLDVALKSLHWNLKESDDALDFLRNEVRLARQIISANVCRIFDLVSEQDQELASMEYIDGITLRQVLEQKAPLDLQDARDIAVQFLAGLDAIHVAGLVHRDLKPENVMITRTGRVVVMDLGIAQQQMQTGGMISGTRPYMSPEQLAGKQVDARSDIFSAGVVLAEMIHTNGKESDDTRQQIWQAVRKAPEELPGSAWKEIIAHAVAEKKENRFESAMALSRALEEIILPSERVEDRSPYPGLRAFTTNDSEYFLGREQEAEWMIKKIQQLHLMALIGPSGAGKTSFIKAGFIPALPKEWRAVITTPGDAPFVYLKQALMPFLPEGEEISFEDPDLVIGAFRQIHKMYPEFVLIVDQFEELFTLNPLVTQSNFVQLLERASLDADIRILLGLRDDFLVRSKDHPALAPIFSELTVLAPLNGAALRRALVQPAMKCGYRFEDETLVEKILSDVEKERIALPLLAFAASLLWEKRDRSRGKLTTQAYTEIGGVRGGLARHAENTLAEIGPENEWIVRELFRNLITAQNTRIAREVEELLSIFPDQTKAEKVLTRLMDARLLTSFEASNHSGMKTRRVEISHESLIYEWPHLVKWQTQDLEYAQFRDELREAARLWAQKGRSNDLLWSGTAYLEFQMWRSRFSGGLTATEDSFVHAMIRNVNKRRRQRYAAVGVAFFALIVVVSIISLLWRRETIAKNNAVLQARRAEAGKVLAVGRSIPGADPTTKVAYALASLESSDSVQARMFALQALSEGPVGRAIRLPWRTIRSMEISPDGSWIAAAVDDGVALLPRNGGDPVILEPLGTSGEYIQWKTQFSPDSKLVIWTLRSSPKIVKVWSIVEKKLVRTFNMEGVTMCLVRGRHAFFITDTTVQLGTPFNWNETAVRVWGFDSSEPLLIGKINLERYSWKNFDIDPQGRWFTYSKAKELYLRSLQLSRIGDEKLLGKNESPTEMIRFHPNGEHIATACKNGEIRLWSVKESERNQFRMIATQAHWPIQFNPSGSFLFTRGEESFVGYDLITPGNPEPHVLRHPEKGVRFLLFDPKAQWVAALAEDILAFYPVADQYPSVFNNKTPNSKFTPDGKSILSGFTAPNNTDGIQKWYMPGSKKWDAETLWTSTKWRAERIDIDKTGKYLLAAVGESEVHVITISDRKDAVLSSSVGHRFYTSVAFSPDSKSVAAASYDGIEIWDLAADLQSSKSRMVEESAGKEFDSLQFAPDGTLYSASDGQLYHWNLIAKSVKIFGNKNGWLTGLAVSEDGRYVATSTWPVKNPGELRHSISQIVIYDWKENKSFPISSHGNRVLTVAFDRQGSKLVTGDLDGIVRVGSILGGDPHLLLGHKGSVADVIVHPGGKWLASMESNSLRLWPIPETKPFLSLPHSELMNRLKSMTNARVVANNNSPNGYSIQFVDSEKRNW